MIVLAGLAAAVATAIALPLALTDGGKAEHSRASTNDPYYIYVFDEEGVREAVALIEAKAGFEVRVPTVEPPLELKSIAATPDSSGGWDVVLEYYNAEYTVELDAPAGDYSGARLRLVELPRTVRPAPGSAGMVFLVSGYEAYMRPDVEHPQGVVYTLIGSDRAFLATTWAEANGAQLSAQAILRMFMSLAR